MRPEVVIAMYRPRKGKDAALRRLISRHLPTLRQLELVTDRPPVLVRSKNGTYLEIFEWRSIECARKAHEHPAVGRIWEAMEKIADWGKLGDLEEAKSTFPHFQPVSR
jgi:hypothetical protein